MTELELRKLKRDGRRDRGQCQRCDEPAIQDRSLCPRHAEIATARIAAARARKMAVGICRQCTNPSVPGRRACDLHLAIARKRATKGVTVKGNQNQSIAARKLSHAHDLYQRAAGTHHEGTALELLYLAILEVRNAKAPHTSAQRVYVEGSFEQFAAVALRTGK